MANDADELAAVFAGVAADIDLESRSRHSAIVARSGLECMGGRPDAFVPRCKSRIDKARMDGDHCRDCTSVWRTSISIRPSVSRMSIGRIRESDLLLCYTVCITMHH